jgi:hypothetical protein
MANLYTKFRKLDGSLKIGAGSFTKWRKINAEILNLDL